MKSSQSSRIPRFRSSQRRPLSQSTSEPQHSSGKPSEPTINFLDISFIQDAIDKPLPPPNPHSKPELVQTRDDPFSSPKSAKSFKRVTDEIPERDIPNISDTSRNTRMNSEGPMVGNMSKIPEDGRRNPIFDSRVEYTVDYSMHETELDIPKEQMTVETLLVKADEAQIPERDNSSSLSSVRDNDYCNLDALLSSASSSDTSLDDVLIANALNPYMEERSWLQFLNFDDEDTHGNLSLDKFERSQNMRKTDYQRTKNHCGPGRASEVLRDSGILNKTGMVDQRKQELHNSNQRRRATSTAQSASFQPSSIRKSDIRKPPASAPLSIMSVQKLRHLGRSHSAKISIPKIDIAVDSFFAHQQLLSSSQSPALKPFITIEIEYSFPMTPVERDIIDASCMQTEKVKLIASCPNPYSRSRYNSAQSSRKSSSLASLPVSLNHQTILPCKFDASMIDHWMNRQITVKYTAFIHVPQKRSSTARRKADHVTTMEKDILIDKIWTGISTFDLKDVLKSDTFKYNNTIPIWKTSINAGNKENVDDGHWQNHWLGDMDIQVEILPSFELPADHTTSLDSLSQPLKLLPPSPIPLYFYIQISRFTSCIPTMPTPSYHVTALSNISSENIPSSNLKIRDVYLSLSARLFPTPGNPILSDEPSKLGQSTFQQSLKSLIPIETKPLIWYREITRTKQGTAVEEVEVERVRPDNPAETGLLDQIDFGFNYMLPISIDASVLETWAKFPLVVELWKLEFDSSLNDMNASTAGLPHPGGSKPKRSLLGLLRIPVHHLLSTLMLSYSRSHDLSTITSSKERNSDLSLFWSTLPMRIPHTEYPVVDILAGETRGWCDVGIAIGQYEHIEDIKKAWTKDGNELKEPQTMPNSSRSPKKEMVTREVGDDIDDGYFQERKSPSKRRQSKSHPKAPVKQRRSKSTKKSLIDMPASASIQATIHRASDLRHLAVHAFADYLDRFPSAVSDSLDDFEAMNNHLMYALQAGLNSYVTLQILPKRFAKQYISTYQTDITSPIAAQEFRPQFHYEASLRLSKIDEKLIRWFREGGSDDLKSNSLLADVSGIENQQNPFGCDKGGQCVGFIYHRVPRDIFQSLDSYVNETEQTCRHRDILIGVFKFGLARLLEYPAGLKQFWLPVRLPRHITQIASLDEQPISSIQLSAKFAVDGGNALQDNDSDPFESVDQKQLVAQLNISVEKLAFKTATGDAPSSTVYFKWNKTDIIDELDLFFSESEPTFVATSEPLELPTSNADSNELLIGFQSSVNIDLQPESLEKLISSVIQLQLWKTNDSSNDEQLLATSFIDMFKVGMKIKKLCKKMTKCVSSDNDIAKYFNFEGDVPCVPALNVNFNDGFSPSSVHVKISVGLKLKEVASQKEEENRTHEINDLHSASKPREESHQVLNLSSHERNDEVKEFEAADDVTRMEITIEKALNLPNVLISSSPHPALTASLSQVPPNAFVTFSWQDDKGIAGPDQTLNESRFSVSSVFRSSIISTTNSSHKQIYSTDVISGSSNPEWNYIVSVPQSISLYALERLRVRKIVVMKVWHRDFHTPTSNDFSTGPSFTDKLIGFSRIDLSPLVSGLRELHGYYQIIDFRGDNIGQLVVGVKPTEDLMGTLISLKRKGDLESTGNHEEERKLENIYIPGLPDLEELKQKVRQFETLASKQLELIEPAPTVQENPNSVEILPLNDPYPRTDTLYIPNIDSSVTENPLTPLLPSICNLPPQPEKNQVESHNSLRQSLSKSLASLDHLQRELKSRLGVSLAKQPCSLISEGASIPLSEVLVSNNTTEAPQTNPLPTDILPLNNLDDDVCAKNVGESDDEISMDPNTFRYATGETAKDTAGSEGTFPQFFAADVLWSEVEMMAKEILESNEDEVEDQRLDENVDNTIPASKQSIEGTCTTIEQITSTKSTDHPGGPKNSQNESLAVDASQVSLSPTPKHKNSLPKDQNEESDDDWDIPMRNLNIKASASLKASASGKPSISSPKKASTTFLSTSQLRDQAKAMEEKLQSALAEFNFPSRTLSYSSTLSRSQTRPQPLPLPPLAFYSSTDRKPPLGPGITNVSIKSSDGKRNENHDQSYSAINELDWSKLSKDESDRIRKIFHDDKRNEESGSGLVE